MATMATDPIADCIRVHIAFARDLLAEREPEHSFEQVMRLVDALDKKYGRDVADRIFTRSKAAVAELVGGEPAPPLTQAGRDPWPVVEADMFAERLVAELRQAGVPRAGADWKVRLNAAVVARRDLEIARLEKRAAAAEEQRKAAAAARAAAAPAPLQHVTLPATVPTVTDTRAAEPPDGIPLGTFRFVWKEGTQYHRGDVVLDQGGTWIAAEDSADRPGTSARWRLFAKGAIGPKKERIAASHVEHANSTKAER